MRADRASANLQANDERTDPHGVVSYAMRPRTEKPDLHREH